MKRRTGFDFTDLTNLKKKMEIGGGIYLTRLTVQFNQSSIVDLLPKKLISN